MKTINFDEHLFRASQSSSLTTGTIGITKDQEQRIKDLEFEFENGINANGNKVKWTETKRNELKKLKSRRYNPELPKTMQTELRQIFRSVKYDRKFTFTNKYVQKGLSQEEESFSVYQRWLEEFKGVKFLLMNNKKRINGDFFTGETDCNEHFVKKFNWGFDIKTSWSLKTFPFEVDELDSAYKWQNTVYMSLYKEVEKIDVEHWKTVYVLVNSTESTLHNEKMKHFYANDMHQSDDNEKKYEEICRDLEKEHIVDYDRFIELYPGHQLVIGRTEWHANGWNIPLKDRVVEKVVEYNKDDVDFIKGRAVIARNFLKTLN